MISKLFLEPKEYSNYSTENASDNSLENLNRINIFIGANNTGKSRLLRSLFVNRNFHLELANFKAGELAELLEVVQKEVNIELYNLGVEDVSNEKISGIKEFFKRHITALKNVHLLNTGQLLEDFNEFWKNVLVFKNQGGSNRANHQGPNNLTLADQKIKNIAANYDTDVKKLAPEKVNYAPERVYIPILRGLRPIQMTDELKFDELKDNYYHRTLKDYFKDDKIQSEEIYTGLRLYTDLKRMLLGKREERIKVQQFENFLSKTFFNSETVSLTPSISDDSVHVLIGETERAIYEIGDGIQSIIILLYPLFFNQGKDLLVFIEEPENSIHPGLQRVFIETLMKTQFNTFQYFISTHSNHFLDITLDLQKVSIYTSKKIAKEETSEAIFLIENSSNENLKTLDLIGVRNSSVFLSNCTIWVEGITDRLYLKKYLEVYQNNLLQEKEIAMNFKEDFNYSFVEYGGGNIVHWSFADESAWEKIRGNRISSKIFLVADKDDTKSDSNSAKSKRLKLLRSQLGDNLNVLSAREIENTLSPKILINTIKKLEKQNASNLIYNESKIKYINYYNKKIGDFIHQNFKNIERRYKADSGTIYCKLEFCKSAVDSIQTIADLSEEGLRIAASMFKFIKTCN